MIAPLPVLVLHFHKRITGVSASAASVVRAQLKRSDLDLCLCGDNLPGLPPALNRFAAIQWIKRQGRTVIVHARRNSEMRFGLLLRDILRLDVKLIFTSAAKRKHSALPRWLIGRMNGVIATSHEAADLVPHVLATVPHGVDIEMFRPDLGADWPALGYGGARGIATIGRVRAEKGTDRFVSALCKILPERADVHALIIGLEKPSDHAFGERLRAQLRAAGIEGRVHFTGALPQVEVAKILPALSLLAALPRYEGYGLTVLEAMAAGVPVVASDAGAFAAMLEGGGGGHIVPNADDAPFAEAMAEVLDKPQKGRDLGQKGRQRVMDQFSSQSESNAIADCYWRLLKA